MFAFFNNFLSTFLPIQKINVHSANIVVKINIFIMSLLKLNIDE